MNKIFTVKKGDLELRSKEETGEIIRWFENMEYCYTLAHWKVSGESYSLYFVEGRPFEETVNQKYFMELAKIGQLILETKN